jgi:HD-like signal output (HDOD) protein
VGLLHDLGIIAEDQYRNPELVNALHLVNAEGLPLWQAEQRILGYDHTHTGAAILKNWQLPDEIIQGIAYHHAPDRAPDHANRIAATLFVANHCCQQSEIGYCDAPLENETLYAHSMEILNIEPHAVELIMADVNALVVDMVEQGIL